MDPYGHADALRELAAGGARAFALRQLDLVVSVLHPLAERRDLGPQLGARVALPIADELRDAAEMLFVVSVTVPPCGMASRALIRMLRMTISVWVGSTREFHRSLASL